MLAPTKHRFNVKEYYRIAEAMNLSGRGDKNVAQVDAKTRLRKSE